MMCTACSSYIMHGVVTYGYLLSHRTLPDLQTNWRNVANQGSIAPKLLFDGCARCADFQHFRFNRYRLQLQTVKREGFCLRCHASTFARLHLSKLCLYQETPWKKTMIASTSPGCTGAQNQGCGAFRRLRTFDANVHDPCTSCMRC